MFVPIISCFPSSQGRVFPIPATRLLFFNGDTLLHAKTMYSISELWPRHEDHHSHMGDVYNSAPNSDKYQLVGHVSHKKEYSVFLYGSKGILLSEII